MRIKAGLLVGVGVAILSLSGCLKDDYFDPQEQFAKEMEAIEQHINDTTYVAVRQDSVFGLWYAELAFGAGNKPSQTDYVNVTYQGRVFGSGKVFDEGDSVVFKLDGLVDGWQILLPYAREGMTVRMFIPSFFGYRTQSVGDIPANSTLEFDVTLNEVTDRFGFEQYLLKQYIDQEDLVTKADTVEGLRYLVTEEGTGDMVQPDETIEVNYKGYTLYRDNTDGLIKLDQFADRSGAFIELETFLSGWRILLPYFKKGSTITLFIPSKFAFGDTGNASGDVGSNTPVIYEVEILE